MARVCRSILCIAAGGTFLALASVSARAHAGAAAIAVDIDYAVPIESDTDHGGGFGVRLGYEAELAFVVATPELVFTYNKFTDNLDPRVYRALAGGRLGVGETFRSGAFFHMGVGNIKPDLPDYSHTDLSYDLGAFVELAVLPSFNVGAHVGYNRVTGGPNALQWASAGGQLAFVF
jgi:hypothetical protein